MKTRPSPTVMQKLNVLRAMIEQQRRFLIRLDLALKGQTPSLEDARKRQFIDARKWALQCVAADYEFLKSQHESPGVDYRVWTCPDCGETQIESTGRVLVSCEHCRRGPYVLRDEVPEKIMGVDYATTAKHS